MTSIGHHSSLFKGCCSMFWPAGKGKKVEQKGQYTGGRGKKSGILYMGDPESLCGPCARLKIWPSLTASASTEFYFMQGPNGRFTQAMRYELLPHFCPEKSCFLFSPKFCFPSSSYPRPPTSSLICHLSLPCCPYSCQSVWISSSYPFLISSPKFLPHS